MRLIDRLRTSTGVTSERLRPAVETVFSSTWGGEGVERTPFEFTAYADAMSANAVLFAVISVRAQLFSEASFKWRNLTTKRLFGTPDLALLEQPWPNGTTGELLTRMEQDASLAGNAFIRREDRRRLWRLRPDWVDIALTPGDPATREPFGYIYWPEGRASNASARVYGLDEVAHWSPIPDPRASYKGMSWITAAVRDVDADDKQSEYVANYFKHDATPNSIIKYQQKLGDGAVERLSALWSKRYGGPDGWKTAILDQGADFQVVGQSFEQMSYDTVRSVGEQRIAAAAGVPGILIGLKSGMDAATFANYSAAMRRFADITMRPNWRSACAALAKLLPAIPAGSELWYDTTDIAALREGEKERADAMQVLASAASTLLMAGYTADSITAALTASDMTLLAHSGLLSVQLQPPGATPPQTGGTP